MTGAGFVLDFFQPVENHAIQPEAGAAAGNKADVAAMVHRHQMKEGILAKRGVIVDLKRDQRIVLGHDDQGRDADLFEILIRRLGAIVIRRGAEAEQAGGVEIVEVVDSADVFEVLGGIDFGRLAVRGYGSCPLVAPESGWRRDS